MNKDNWYLVFNQISKQDIKNLRLAFNSQKGKRKRQHPVETYYWGGFWFYGHKIPSNGDDRIHLICD